MKWGFNALLLFFFSSTALFAEVSMASRAGWDWQLSQPYDLSVDVAVLDIDPDNHSPAEITALSARGVYTICYVSVGTLESYRDDVVAFPPSVIGDVYGDWPDERFLDIRRLDILLPLMQARFERCQALGFDAIEPDNMDVYENMSGFALTSSDAIIYVKALADIAHRMGLAIGQKNVPNLTADLVNHLDFVITEGCHHNNWCGDIATYASQNKPIFSAEYTDTDIDFAAACRTADTASLILKDRNLTSFRSACP